MEEEMKKMKLKLIQKQKSFYLLKVITLHIVKIFEFKNQLQNESIFSKLNLGK